MITIASGWRELRIQVPLLFIGYLLTIVYSIVPLSKLAMATKRTPSGYDWRWAQGRLRSDESLAVLIQRLEDYRYDKPRPQYYARRTVTRAYAKVALSRGAEPEEVIRTISAHPPRVGVNGEQYARGVVEEFQAKLGRGNQQGRSGSVRTTASHQQLGLEVMPS